MFDVHLYVRYGMDSDKNYNIHRIIARCLDRNSGVMNIALCRRFIKVDTTGKGQHIEILL